MYTMYGLYRGCCRAGVGAGRGAGLHSLHRLERRALLRVCGAGVGEAGALLQGLLTNDMRHLQEGSSSLYAMFLNTRGRVLYDTLVHRCADRDDHFLLEIDREALDALQKHLKMYRLRKKIDIEVADELSLYALAADAKTKDTPKDIKVHKDPRISALGSRVIAPISLSPSELCKSLGDDITLSDSEDYAYLRYRLGVSEGICDLPPDICFPLEANCDYLHGVSFHKGCYIGQELTARVHHTGVVRKRYMPIKFNSPPTEPIEKDSVISSSENPKSNLGKLKGVIRDYGLALLRITEALQADALVVGKQKVRAEKPIWWPVEAPKEKLNVKLE